MKFILIALLILSVVVLYYSVTTYQKFKASRSLVASAEPFTQAGTGEPSLLVLGDSTAVGVGADQKKDSVPALFANAINATSVVNAAASGARVADLEAQLPASTPQYTYILIQIGGNDIIRGHSPEIAAQALAQTLAALPKHDHLVVLTAGNVGGATFFPWFVRPYYTNLNQKYHRAFAAVVEAAGGTYVNLYEPPKTDPFVQEPEVYLAADGLHPSSAGYALWFEKIQTQVGI